MTETKTVSLGPIKLNDQHQRKLAVYAALFGIIGFVVLLIAKNHAATTGATASTGASDSGTSGTTSSDTGTLTGSTTDSDTAITTALTNLQNTLQQIQQAASNDNTKIGVTFADNFTTTGSSSSTNSSTSQHSGGGSAGINIFGITIGGTGSSNANDTTNKVNTSNFTQNNTENLGFSGLNEGDLPTVSQLLNELTGAQQTILNGSQSTLLAGQQIAEITSNGLNASTTHTSTGITTVINNPTNVAGSANASPTQTHH